MLDHETDSPQRRRVRWWVALAALAAVLLLVLVLATPIFPFASKHNGFSSPSASVGTSTASMRAEQNMTGNELMQAFARRLVDSAADRSTGPYTAIHTKVWGNGTAVEYKTWHTPMGFPHYGEIRKQPSLSASQFDLSKVNLDFSAAPREVDDGHCHALIPDLELSGVGDPVKEIGWYLMVGQGGTSTPSSASVKVNAVADLLARQITPTSTRSAALQWLALIPGWTHRRGTDLSGRPGLIFELSDSDARHTLTFDDTTGQILASQAKYGTKGLSYFLVVSQTRTTTVPPDVLPNTAPTGDPKEKFRDCRHT